MRRAIIVCGSTAEAREFANRMQLGFNEYVVVARNHDLEKIFGLLGGHPVFLHGTWMKHFIAKDLLSLLKARQFVIFEEMA